MIYKILLAKVLKPVNEKESIYIEDGALVFSGERVIAVGRSKDLLSIYNGEILDFKDKILIPPFYDLHFHWVQDDVRDKPKESLLDWLSNYTWPNESLFHDIHFTNKKAEEFKNELYKNGTLGGAIYAAIYPHTVTAALEKFSGDFYCGNVLMTMNSPDYLTFDEQTTLRGVQELEKLHGNRYIFTPRFAITTDPSTMRYGKEFVKRGDLLQTHLSENKKEIETVLSIYRDLEGFEDVPNYTEIYDRVGLLSPKTLLAHGIHLSDKELALLRKRDSVIIHCPTSNAPIDERGLGSGLFNFRKSEKFGVRWALGSDIGGGPYLSMFDVINSFVSQNHRQKIFEATYTKAFFKATLGGARILNSATTFLEPNSFATFVLIDAPLKGRSTGEEILKEICQERSSSRESFSSVVAASFIKGVNYYLR